MINKEFQELNRKYSVNKDSEERERLLLEMRKNLKRRNSGNSTYAKGYIDAGKIIDIDAAEYALLLEINGDMNPLGR